MGKVTGLDWSFFKENELITCGQDKHVKVGLANFNTNISIIV